MAPILGSTGLPSERGYNALSLEMGALLKKNTCLPALCSLSAIRTVSFASGSFCNWLNQSFTRNTSIISGRLSSQRITGSLSSLGWNGYIPMAAFSVRLCFRLMKKPALPFSAAAISTPGSRARAKLSPHSTKPGGASTLPILTSTFLFSDFKSSKLQLGLAASRAYSAINQVGVPRHFDGSSPFLVAALPVSSQPAQAISKLPAINIVKACRAPNALFIRTGSSTNLYDKIVAASVAATPSAARIDDKLPPDMMKRGQCQR